MPAITVDSREQARLVDPILDELMMEDRFKDIVVKREKLDYGDYLIEDGKINILIERKTIVDFVSSYAKGHLQDKLFTMRLTHDRTMLLIEGTPKIKGDSIITYRDYGINRKTFLRFLIDQQEKGTWIWRTNDLDDTLYQVFLMAENLAHMVAPNPIVKCGNPRELFLQLPGLGAKKLESLMKKYDTPAYALAHVDDWATPAIKKALLRW
jgi:ERCC4-type nuclease